MANKIVIRADGGSTMGLGHLIRCQALAEMLSSDFNVEFYCQEIPDSLASKFKQKNFRVINIEEESEFLDILSGNEIVVLDHYGLDASFQKNIKDKGNKLVCIDDLHDKNFYADLIINHAPGISAQDYKAQSYTQYALGLDYVLLRPEFLEVAKHKGKKSESSKRAIFICFGGSDPEDITKRSLDVVLELDLFDEIKIVTGSGYTNYDFLAEQVSSNGYPGVFLYRNLEAADMISIMKSCNHALVPSSGILLEVIAVGLKPVSGMYIANQKFIYENYKSINAFVDAGNFDEETMRKAFLSFDFNEIETPTLIDGRSFHRLVKLFSLLSEEKTISLDRAGIDDLKITYKWATEPSVRLYSFSKSEIRFEEHMRWFYSKIEDENCYYFIARKNNSVLGSIRFDKNNKDEVMVSYLLDPGFHGRGLGLSLLKLGVEKLKKIDKEIKSVVGYVMSDNIASLKIFRKLGYEEYLENERKFKFKKQIR